MIMNNSLLDTFVKNTNKTGDHEPIKIQIYLNVGNVTRNLDSEMRHIGHVMKQGVKELECVDRQNIIIGIVGKYGIIMNDSICNI